MNWRRILLGCRTIVDCQRNIRVLALSGMLCLIVVAAFTLELKSPGTAVAEGSDTGSVLYSDFDADSEDDVLVAEPSGVDGDDSSPGEVYLTLSDGFDQIDQITFRGETSGDRFGEDIAAADLTGNGFLDLVVGAPLGEVTRSDGTTALDGAVYVFFSPFFTDENGVLLAEDADLRIQSRFDKHDDGFGIRVAPLHDVTGNGLPEIRVMSFADDGIVDVLGGSVITQIFDGSTGEFIFAIITTDDFDPWHVIPGDVTGDGAVHQGDIDRIMANMGLEADDVTVFDGDVNGDGVVDALDLAIALDHFGIQLVDVVWNENGRPDVYESNMNEITEVWRYPIVGTPGCGEPHGLCCCCSGECDCGDCGEPPEPPEEEPECEIEVCCRPVLGSDHHHCFLKCNNPTNDEHPEWACGGREGSKRGTPQGPGVEPGYPNTAPDCPNPGFRKYPIDTYCGPFRKGNPEFDNAKDWPDDHHCTKQTVDCDTNPCDDCFKDTLKSIQDCCFTYTRPKLTTDGWVVPEPCQNSNSSAFTALTNCVDDEIVDPFDPIMIPEGGELSAPCWGNELDLSDCNE